MPNKELEFQEIDNASVNPETLLNSYSISATTTSINLSSLKQCSFNNTAIRTIKYKKKTDSSPSIIWKNGRKPKIFVRDSSGRIYTGSQIKKMISSIRFHLVSSEYAEKFDTTISSSIESNFGPVWQPDCVIQQSDRLAVTVNGKDWMTMSEFSVEYTDGSNPYTIYSETKNNLKSKNVTANWIVDYRANGNSNSDYIVFYITLEKLYVTSQVNGYFTTDNSGGFFDFRFKMSAWFELGYSAQVALSNMKCQLLIDDNVKIDGGTLQNDKLMMQTAKDISNERHKYTMRVAPKDDFIDWTAINVYSYSGYFETSRSNVTWGGSAYSSSGGGGGGGSGGGSSVDPYT